MGAALMTLLCLAEASQWASHYDHVDHDGVTQRWYETSNGSWQHGDFPNERVSTKEEIPLLDDWEVGCDTKSPSKPYYYQNGSHLNVTRDRPTKSKYCTCSYPVFSPTMVNVMEVIRRRMPERQPWHRRLPVMERLLE